MLLIGIILLTSYLTKVNYIPEHNKPNNNNNEFIPTIDEVYSMKPSQIYDSMFSKPSLWQGYESVNVKK